MRFHVAYENIDTIVEMTPTHHVIKRFNRTLDGQKATHVRALVFDAPLREEKLGEMADLAAALKDGDPEINIEAAGKMLTKTEHIAVDKDLRPVYTYREFDVMTRPDGAREERPHAVILPNIDEVIPVKVTDKLFDPRDIATKFLISRSFYLSHTDGVSYKFLFEIAENLARAGKFARVQAYDPVEKKPAPLLLRIGTTLYPAAFLEGRVRSEEYCLLLHLSAQELKVPKFAESEPEANPEEGSVE